MDGYSENNPTMMKPGGFQEGIPMESRKLAEEMGNKRQALRDIKNFVGAPPPYPRAINKRRLPEKFAASLAEKQLSHQDISRRNDIIKNEKIERAIPSIPSSNNLANITVIDVEEYMDPLPDYVKQTEAMLEEMEAMDDCDLEEVEMTDPDAEPDVDIDSSDSNNPLAVVDYVEDIYTYYRQTEVHYKFELMDETLFLTVNLIDRFLERQMVGRKKLQLVGVTALLLACKYEEVSVPFMEDLVLISDRAYTRDEILTMEKLMVNTLQFDMSVPTPYVFMRRFLKAAESEKKLELLSFFMIELCLVEYKMLKFPPSLLAAAAIYTAQCTIKGFRHWSKTSERYTRYSEDQLLECSMLMVDFHQNAAMGKLTGIHRKYSTSKFGHAAKTKPAHFLLEGAPHNSSGVEGPF
ncbi:hypothetical protein AAC387_Pa07g1110 [Persea americana]